jgi:mycothiol maleylpyruvate isomerase-like protein
MRHTQAGVIDRAQREFSELDALVSRLSAEDWQRRVPRSETKDPWTVKDALAHIVYWKLHTARVFRGERRPPEMRGLDVPRINHLVYEEWRKRSPDEVVAWHHDVHAQVMVALAAKPEEWFDHHERSAYWPADFGSHSEAHRRKDIEAALQ